MVKDPMKGQETNISINISIKINKANLKAIMMIQINIKNNRKYSILNIPIFLVSAKFKIWNIIKKVEILKLGKKTRLILIIK